tara:strand:+ start:232 stop:390 length:159 start_codon:yes stop_codon:yes gene_type:complete
MLKKNQLLLLLEEMEPRKVKMYHSQKRFPSLMEMVPGELPKDTPLSTVKVTE